MNQAILTAFTDTLCWEKYKKDFLVFFFTRLRRNDLPRYADTFPWLSLCGRERNFVRCDDVPIVYTHLLPNTDYDGVPTTPVDVSAIDTTVDPRRLLFSYCNGGERLSVPFDPAHLCMLPETGRVYYPAPATLHGGQSRYGPIGLVRSALALQLAPLFVFGDGADHPPTAIRWCGATVALNNELLTVVEASSAT